MAKKFNPFHEWLGLDRKLTNPHHFQLLGVSPKIADPAKFKKAAHVAAQAQLAKLKAIDVAAERAELKKKLRARIVLAHDILMDDKKRTTYVQELKAKLKQASKSTKMSAGSFKAAQSGIQKAPPLIDESISEAPTVVPTTTPTPDSEAAAPFIPMAVPLAPPASESGIAVPDVTAAPNSDAPSFDNLDADGVKVYPGRRGRKKGSWLVPVLSLLFMLAGVIGISSLVLNYDNLFSSLKPPVDDKVVGEVVSPVVDEERPLRDPNLANTNTNSDPADAENANDPESNAEKIEKIFENKPKDEDPSEAMSEKGSSPEKSDNPFGTVKLGDNQVETLKFCFRRARNMLARGHDQEARELLEFAKSAFADVKVVGPQNPLRKELDGAIEVAQQIEGYWKQVKESCVNMPGGQDIEVGQQIVGFVEGREDDAVLAIGGDRNVFIPYRSMRPGLSQALAKQGAIKSIPRWRLQEASHYAIHAYSNAGHNRKAIALIAKSEADGFDGSKLRDFIESKYLSVGRGNEPVDDVNDERIVELTNELRDGRYEDPLSQPPAEAAELAEQLLRSMPEDNEMRIASLSEAMLLSVAANDPFQLLDVVSELKRWRQQFDPRGCLERGFAEIAKKDLSKAELRFFGEAFLEFLNTPEATEVKDTLRVQMKSAALQMMTDAGLLDLARRIEQTMVR